MTGSAPMTSHAPMTRSTTIICIAALCSLSSLARAQPDAAQAEHFFKEGRRLMDEGNIAEACTAFEASYGKDASLSTLMNLGNCREKNHQFASAWGHFIDAARMARGDQEKWKQVAQQRADALEPRLSYLVINVPADSKIEGLVITMNGKPVAENEWNWRFPVDGGEYKIEGKAPGHEPWNTTIKIAAAKDTQAITVPKFHALPAGLISTSVTSSPREPWHADRVGWAIAAGGAVATIGGGGLMLNGDSLYGQAADEDRQSVRAGLEDKARQRVMIGAVTGGVGVVLLTVGIIKLARVPQRSSERHAMSIHVGASGFAVSGRF
jgi:hypothetical protein